MKFSRAIDRMAVDTSTVWGVQTPYSLPCLANKQTIPTLIEISQSDFVEGYPMP